ncbi:peptidase inhibitor family I36 protein [Streptomyces pakalii]|uniref:Peptidase inhibitor family I36 protein n=1 Tax=Streptomyces pakalii TaxID=3036494 RepID=A0ABT7DI91_9ACTN|nr:peptidase inhibitor family I36 protein [Streptomyces pakalii]MDJ1645383.1 peptidase inhibitor family I36 protein [Streptomyces pakalii]
MRKFTVTVALIGLTALGVTAPTAAAQATENTVAANGCATKTTPRDGKMYAWDTLDCQGPSMYSATGNSNYWGAADTDKASSVINRGFLGGLDVVMFFRNTNQSGPHTCLTPGELYADDLRDNRFTDGSVVTNAISSHKWVTRSACSVFLT